NFGLNSKTRRLARCDVVAFDLRIQSRGVEAEEAGGSGLVAAGLFEGPADEIDLEPFYLVVKVHPFCKIDLTRRTLCLVKGRKSRSRVANLRPQALDGDLVGCGDDHRPLNYVLKFADIAWEVVTFEQREDLGRNVLRDLTAVLLVIFADEVLGEGQYILRTFPQRRQLDRYH